LKFTSQYKNYIVTFGIEFLILLLGFVVFRIANEKMTDIGFSEYTLSRRNISFLQPLLMVGLGVAVPRFVSIYPHRNTFLPSSLLLMGIISCFFLLISVSSDQTLAHIFFGDSSYESYILPIVLLLSGYGFHAIIYGFLRGKREVYFSNLIQLFNIGVIPLIVLLYTQDVKSLLYMNSILLYINILIFTVFIFKKRKIYLDKAAFKEDIIVLLKYGLPRVLGDVALLALLTFPTYIVLNFQKDLILAGDVAYSITLFNLVGAVFGPLCLVLLPEIAGFMSEKRIDLIQKRFNVFVVGSLLLTFLGYLFFFIFHEFILTILLGKNHRKELFGIASVVLTGSFGYVLYIVLRSFLDAIHVKAKNATNLLISLGVYVVLTVFGYFNAVSITTYLYFFAISVTLLGILTWIKTYITLKEMR
jgi:O-antigen/teichoic acid export membrane protein